MVRLKKSYLIILFLLSFVFPNDFIPKKEKSFFISDLKSQMQYFRLKLNENEIVFNKLENNNIIFLLPLKSRRNNYEEIILISFGCIGRSIQNQINNEMLYNKPSLIPSIITIECIIPNGREETLLSASINNKLLIQFIEGTINSESFWKEVKNSAQLKTNSDWMVETPSIFLTDIDFENLISTRMALESRDNPKVEKLLGLASKVNYIPGLKNKLENMLIDHMKNNHTDLMAVVLGSQPTEEQIIRIGKQFFFQAQQPSKILTISHTSDSLRYVWKGNTYPRSLDQFYEKYRIKYPRNNRN